MDKDFLKEVFKETNAHIRATEQKSLVMTGAFVGFYLNGFTGVLKGQGIAASSFADPWLVILFHLALLVVGTIVYAMQLWYRAWKEHYMVVCFELRKQFVPILDSEAPFPYWLRQMPKAEGRFSLDNLVMYVTLLVNMGVLFLVANDILEFVKNQNAAILSIAGAFVAYLTLVTTANRVMRSPTFLHA
jgi:hypothetical protein